MTYVGRYILPGQIDGLTLLGLEHILAALRLHAALEFPFCLGVAGVLIGLSGLAHTRLGCVWLLPHAG